MFGYRLLGTIAVPLGPHTTVEERAKALADSVYSHGYDYIVPTRLSEELRKATNTSALMVFEVWTEVIRNG